MNELGIVRRNGWENKCPSCGQAYLWTKFNVMDAVTPYLYCDRKSDILLRRSDRNRIFELVQANGRHEPDAAVLKDLWVEMENSAPLCVCGGRFSISAPIRCPQCATALWQQSIEQLIHTNWIIVVDGVAVIRDEPGDSYRVAVEV